MNAKEWIVFVGAGCGLLVIQFVMWAAIIAGAVWLVKWAWGVV